MVSGEVMPEARLIRFVAGPDGAVVPDLGRKLPGRGVWVEATREAVTAAVKKNSFARSAKAPLKPAPDLADQVEQLLVRRCLDQLGLARRRARLYPVSRRRPPPYGPQRRHGGSRRPTGRWTGGASCSRFAPNLRNRTCPSAVLSRRTNWVCPQGGDCDTRSLACGATGRTLDRRGPQAGGVSPDRPPRLARLGPHPRVGAAAGRSDGRAVPFSIGLLDRGSGGCFETTPRSWPRPIRRLNERRERQREPRWT